MKGQCQLFIGEHQSEILRVNAGIVATPLFWVNIPMVCERIGLGTEFSRAETDFYFYLYFFIQFSDLEAEPMVVVWQSVHEGPPFGLVCMDW